MRQWNRLLSLEATSTTNSAADIGSLQVAWGHPEKGWRTSCSYAYYGAETGSSIYPPRAIVSARILCHLLLDLISDEGLQEIREYLLEAFKFYDRPSHPAALPSPPETFPAVHGETYERPSFKVIED